MTHRIRSELSTISTAWQGNTRSAATKDRFSGGGDDRPGRTGASGVSALDDCQYPTNRQRIAGKFAAHEADCRPAVRAAGNQFIWQARLRRPRASLPDYSLRLEPQTTVRTRLPAMPATCDGGPHFSPNTVYLRNFPAQPPLILFEDGGFPRHDSP